MSDTNHPVTDAELAERKKHLDPLQFRVTQEEATEPPFRNTYFDNHAAGIYVDVVSGEPLFSSREKFESGSGWPSFFAPLSKENVVSRSDGSAGMRRTEVRSKRANSHLGHVFEDGPRPTGLRYCINSAALRFVPAERLAAEGYAQFAALFPDVKQAPAAPAAGAFSPAAEAAALQNRTGVAGNLEVSVLGGGCFWGMQELLRKLPGVMHTDVGYAGGAVETAHYELTHDGSTGHAESVRIVFDPKKLSYDALITYFFRIHDPTTADRQGNDRGSQYRSVIFAQSPEQERVARAVKERLDRSGKLRSPSVTQIVPAMVFTLGEDYHQDYLQKHPNGYTCHFERPLTF